MVSVVADAGILTGPGEGVRFGECRGLGKIVFADLDGAVGGDAGLEDDASVVRERGRVRRSASTGVGKLVA